MAIFNSPIDTADYVIIIVITPRVTLFSLPRRYNFNEYDLKFCVFYTKNSLFLIKVASWQLRKSFTNRALILYTCSAGTHIFNMAKEK